MHVEILAYVGLMVGRDRKHTCNWNRVAGARPEI
jgi:hypothetical protein